MYPEWMEKLFIYFNLCGFCTQFKTSSNQKKCDRLFFLFHLSLVSITTLGVYAFLNRPTNDNLGAMNDAMKLIANLIVYWLSILELNSKQKMQRKFWHILKQINQHHSPNQSFSFNAYLIKMIIYFVLLTSMFINYYIIFISGDENAAILYCFWFCFTLIVMFCKQYLFYYLFYLEFMKYELKIVSDELDKMRCFCEKAKFKWIRKFYETIYDLCDIVNAVFGWSNAVAISVSFLLILADINWMNWKLFNKYRIDLIGKSLMNIS